MPDTNHHGTEESPIGNQPNGYPGLSAENIASFHNRCLPKTGTSWDLSARSGPKVRNVRSFPSHQGTGFLSEASQFKGAQGVMIREGRFRASNKGSRDLEATGKWGPRYVTWVKLTDAWLKMEGKADLGVDVHRFWR